MSRSKTKNEFDLPQQTRDLPASHGMVLDLRNEMVSRFDKMDQKFDQVDKKFDQVDKRFDAVDKRFDQVDKRFDEVDKRFDQVDKRFDEVIARIDEGRAEMRAMYHEAMLKFEEQRSENRIVSEGYSSLSQRQDRLETRMDGFDDTLRSLRRSRSKQT